MTTTKNKYLQLSKEIIQKMKCNYEKGVNKKTKIWPQIKGREDTFFFPNTNPIRGTVSINNIIKALRQFISLNLSM